MSKNTKICFSLSVVLALILGVGLGTYASTTYGTEADPLVTLSYLTEKHTPEVMAKLDELLASKNAEIDKKINDAMLLQGEIKSDTFTVVSLREGQILQGSVGCELMLRLGTLICEAENSPGLINTSTGSSINNGTGVDTNNLYMVTIAENGVRATSDNVKVLVRGEYTIK